MASRVSKKPKSTRSSFEEEGSSDDSISSKESKDSSFLQGARRKPDGSDVLSLSATATSVIEDCITSQKNNFKISSLNYCKYFGTKPELIVRAKDGGLRVFVTSLPPALRADPSSKAYKIA